MTEVLGKAMGMGTMNLQIALFSLGTNSAGIRRLWKEATFAK